MWWWDPATARRCLRVACDRILADLAHRRSDAVPSLPFADIADYLGRVEGDAAIPGGLGLLPVAYVELSHALGEALFAVRTRKFSEQSTMTKAAELFLGEIAIALPVGAGLAGIAGQIGITRSPSQTCYAGLVLAGLAADRAARLLLRGGAPSVARLPAVLAQLGAARADYLRLRGDSSAPTPLGRLYVGTAGDVLFSEATEAIDVALAPLAIEIAEQRLPFAQLQELSAPAAWESFRGVMSAWGLGDTLGGGGDDGGLAVSDHVSSTVRDIEGTMAALGELQAVGRFLRDAALASPPLVQLLEQAAAADEAASSGLSLAVAQETLAALEGALADVPPVPLLALRVFSGQPGSHMFRGFFHELAAESMRESRSVSCAVARGDSLPPPQSGVEWRGHVRAGAIAKRAASQLEALVLDGNVLISTFASMASAIERALAGLPAQRVDEELQLIRAFVAARDALESGTLNVSTGVLTTYGGGH